MPTSRARLFAKYAFDKRCVARSIKVALVVGTILALINHYESIIAGSLGLAVTLQILLTYAVPYSVSTFGSAMQAMQMETDSKATKPNSEGSVKSSVLLLPLGSACDMLLSGGRNL